MMDKQVGPDSTAPTNVRWRVAVWLAVVAAIAYLSRTSISAAQGEISASLSLTEKQMGLVMGPAFFWPYALTQIPTAWLGQRFGSRLCSRFTAGSSLAVLIFSGSISLLMLFIAWMAMGIGQAAYPCHAVHRCWHPLTERSARQRIARRLHAGRQRHRLLLAGWLIVRLGWRNVPVDAPRFVWAAGSTVVPEFPARSSLREYWRTGVDRRRYVPDAFLRPASHAPRRLFGSRTMWMIAPSSSAGARAGLLCNLVPVYLRHARRPCSNRPGYRIAGDHLHAGGLRRRRPVGLCDAGDRQPNVATYGVATTMLLLCIG
jgi:hypothetical protein